MNFFLRLLSAIAMMAAGWFASENAEFIEFILVDAGWSGWWLSVYTSRILTGSSIALGALLVFLPGRKNVIIGSAIALAFGLLLLSILQPLSLNLTRCYVCLSEIEKISRYQGIFLWGIVVILLGGVYATRAKAKSLLPAWTAWVLLIGLISIPFILNYPAHWAIYGEQPETPMDRDLNLSRMDTVQFDGGNFEYSSALWEKPQLVILASLSCPYCNRAAYKMHIMREQYPDYPVVMLLTGDTASLSVFVRRANLENVPYLLMNGLLFNDLCEGRVPRIFVVENGRAKKEITYWGIKPETMIIE
jgi:glutaredoxin